MTPTQQTVRHNQGRSLAARLVCGLLVAAAGTTAAHAQTSSLVTVEEISIRSLATIRQAGDGNGARITQNGTALSADVSLEGNNNLQGRSVIQSGSGSQVLIEVLGDRNSVRAEQDGGTRGNPANNAATIEVVGTDNTSEVSQTNAVGGGYGNLAVVEQLGGYNLARIEQRVDPELLTAGINRAEIRQTGHGNDARISQQGAGNSALILQEGSGNFGSLVQQGDGYTAELQQLGDGLSYSITQSPCLIGAAACSDATILVRQSSGGAFVPPQSGG